MPVEEPDNDFSLVIPGQMPDGDVEIGYFLKRSAWSKGYATEVCKRLLEFAFQESPLNEVLASVNEENVASKNVLEKSGFVDGGRMRCYGEDSPIWRITRDEWAELERSALQMSTIHVTPAKVTDKRNPQRQDKYKKGPP